MIYLLTLIIGLLVGFYARELLIVLKSVRNNLKRLFMKPEPKHGVVREGKMVAPVSTKPVENEGRPAGVVHPKSAQQIELEEKIKFTDGLR